MKTQGRRGEIAAEIHTDFPERFAERRRLFVLDEQGGRRELRLQDFWLHKGFVVLKFSGVDSIDDAEKLLRCEIQIPRSERVQLEADASYVSDLVGCRVVAREAGQAARELGRVTDVQFSAGDAPLLVVRGEKEYLVPFAQEYLARVDLEKKRLEMDLPEGMLDLDAPLSREEKHEQQG